MTSKSISFNEFILQINGVGDNYVKSDDLRDIIRANPSFAKQVYEGEGDSNGWTALMCCANMGRFEVVQHLVTSGADINFRDQHLSRTPLMIASIGNHSKIVDFFLINDCDYRAVDWKGESAYELATNIEIKKKIGVYLKSQKK